MRDDVLDRIQRAIDAGAAVDDELEREFSTDPEAMRLASELVAIDEALRNWPEPRVSDKTLDAIVMRVEQRLDERLAPIGDPTAAPVFEDEEAIAISIAPPVSRSPDVAELRQLATPPRHSAETLPPDLLESIPPEAPADLVASIARMPARTDERFEIPSVRPQPVVVPLAKRSERAPTAPPPKKSGATVIWLVGGTLAAAAAVLLAVAVGTFGTTRSEVALSEPAAATSESAEPAATTPIAPAPPPSAMPIGAGGGGADTMLAREEAAGEAEFDEGALAGQELALDLADAAEPPAEETQGSPARTVETSSADRRARSDDPGDEQRRGGGAASPTREQILAAMRAIAPAVGACGGGARTGVAEVRVRVGSSGRVQSAVVIGQFAGTPEGTCIARAVRSARVPPFRQASFDFTYPFRIN